MKTDDLIDRLARNATAVTPLLAPGPRTVIWLLWAAIYLVGVAVMMRLTMSVGGVTVTPLYLMQQGAALLAGIAAARAAFVSVIPGAPSHASKVALVCVGIWLAAVGWGVAADARVAGTIGLTAQSDWPCVASMVLGGIVLGVPLAWTLRSGAPLTPRVTAFFVGLAALSVANIEACLSRPHVFASTVLLWHGTTIGVVALTCSLIGRQWFRWSPVKV